LIVGRVMELIKNTKSRMLTKQTRASRPNEWGWGRKKGKPHRSKTINKRLPNNLKKFKYQHVKNKKYGEKHLKVIQGSQRP